MEADCKASLSIDAKAARLGSGTVGRRMAFTQEEIERLDYAKRRFAKIAPGDLPGLFVLLGLARPRSPEHRPLIQRIRETAERYSGLRR
jgi:hypothetical protein